MIRPALLAFVAATLTACASGPLEGKQPELPESWQGLELPSRGAVVRHNDEALLELVYTQEGLQRDVLVGLVEAKMAEQGWEKTNGDEKETVWAGVYGKGDEEVQIVIRSVQDHLVLRALDQGKARGQQVP